MPQTHHSTSGSSRRSVALLTVLHARADRTVQTSFSRAVRRAVEDALFDRTVIKVSPKADAEFLARLDAPPEPNDRLRRTMRASKRYPTR